MVWLDGSGTTRTQSQLEAAARAGDVYAFDGAVGDGVANDYTALQAKLTAAAGKDLVLQRGKTYLVGTALVPTAGTRIRGNGATIKRAVALNGQVLNVTSADVEITDLLVDGNASGGNTSILPCVAWSGARGVARRVKAIGGAFGFAAAGAGAQLDAFDCEASGHVTYGFSADSGARMRLYNYRADNNGSGVVFGAGAAAGCHFDGTSNNNFASGGAGVKIFAPAGTCGRYVGSNNRGYGIYGFGSAVCKDWSFAYVEDNDAGAGLGGLYTPNSAATGVELFGVSGFNMPAVVVRRAVGYGVALTRDTGTSVGCVNCAVTADVTGCGDPAFHISGASNHNVVRGSAMNSTVAVSFGEGVPGQSDDNMVDIEATGCTYAVLNLNQGSRNVIKIRSKDCVTHAPYTSLIRVGVIGGGGAVGICTDNTIYWESSNPTTTKPAYIMVCDVSVNPATNKTTGNRLVTNWTPDYLTGVLSDPNGQNNAWLSSKTAL